MLLDVTILMANQGCIWKHTSLDTYIHKYVELHAEYRLWKQQQLHWLLAFIGQPLANPRAPHFFLLQLLNQFTVHCGHCLAVVVVAECVLRRHFREALMCLKKRERA